MIFATFTSSSVLTPFLETRIPPSKMSLKLNFSVLGTKVKKVFRKAISEMEEAIKKLPEADGRIVFCEIERKNSLKRTSLFAYVLLVQDIPFRACLLR